MKPQTKRALTWLVIIFVIFMIATAPVTAAEWVRQGIAWAGDGVEGLFTFFEALV